MPTIRSRPPHSTGVYYRIYGKLPEKVKLRRRTPQQSCGVFKIIKIDGEPFLMRYNPPWTLPFLRRNEVAVRVKL